MNNIIIYLFEVPYKKYLHGQDSLKPLFGYYFLTWPSYGLVLKKCETHPGTATTFLFQILLSSSGLCLSYPLHVCHKDYYTSIDGILKLNISRENWQLRNVEYMVSVNAF